MSEWTIGGDAVNRWTRWTRKNHWGLLARIQEMGIVVFEVGHKSVTMQLVEYLMERDMKEVSTLLARPKPSTPWGRRVDDKAYGVHVLTSFPGIGVTTAQKIMEKFGGVPLFWGASKKQMMEIEGLGEKKVERIYKVLERE